MVSKIDIRFEKVFLNDLVMMYVLFIGWKKN
jgi:hypothetical protein